MHAVDVRHLAPQLRSITRKDYLKDKTYLEIPCTTSSVKTVYEFF
jgi:hypothetical protein